MEQHISENPIEILKIFRVGRMTEAASFESHLGNVQSLFHASSAENFVGIFSRGLLLPKMVVEEHGLERTDCGHLGSGIYFSDSVSACLNYSWPNKTDGTRLLLICDVALGKCWETSHMDSSLTTAPSGYDSVHGLAKLKGKRKKGRDFKDDEFVVYRTSQVKLRYVVNFRFANDKVKESQLEIQPGLAMPPEPHQSEDYKMPSRNLLDEVTAGLLDKSGNPIPLKDVHIKGRIIDFVAEVAVFQVYENQTDSPIEAKYVFPLDDTAAVCGFEAFIKGKHIIGEVKEKEKAHQEYRKAISQGHGAYLMDQDAPDIFTVSVGNLPPSTKVLIKITYITELSYENGCLSFHLPAAVAPWQQDKALNENTQDSVRKVSIKQIGAKPGGFSLEMSIEMPFEINHISSWTHQLEIKKTDCKAVVRTAEDSILDVSGFAMEILIGDVHLPRMWVEKHPEKESEACMLVFQPEFEAAFDPVSTYGETIICIDCSNSMAGSEIQQAKQIALAAVDLCSFITGKISIITFGTNFVEFPSNPEPYATDFTALKQFIISATARMGNSDLWKALHYLSLLPPSESKRNILIISDGHIQNECVTLQIVKKNTQHTRIFTCGVGPAANRHMLRTLSQYGAGAFEYFDVKTKYNWERKIKSQTTRMFSPGCNAVSVKWQQFDSDAPELMYAPAQIQSLFNHDHLLIYGFISHCTQATLNALIDGQELENMVSTTELQKTRGTMLHKLAARAFICDYEQGILDEDEIEHEMKKQMLKSLIVQLSLENSVVTQFTSFVAIEKRDTNEDQTADTLNALELVAKEDVDILPYMDYQTKPHAAAYSLKTDKAVVSICSTKLKSEEISEKKTLGKRRRTRRLAVPPPAPLLFSIPCVSALQLPITPLSELELSPLAAGVSGPAFSPDLKKSEVFITGTNFEASNVISAQRDLTQMKKDASFNVIQSQTNSPSPPLYRESMLECLPSPPAVQSRPLPTFDLQLSDASIEDIHYQAAGEMSTPVEFQLRGASLLETPTLSSPPMPCLDTLSSKAPFSFLHQKHPSPSTVISGPDSSSNLQMPPTSIVGTEHGYRSFGFGSGVCAPASKKTSLHERILSVVPHFAALPCPLPVPDLPPPPPPPLFLASASGPVPDLPPPPPPPVFGTYSSFASGLFGSPCLESQAIPQDLTMQKFGMHKLATHGAPEKKEAETVFRSRQRVASMKSTARPAALWRDQTAEQSEIFVSSDRMHHIPFSMNAVRAQHKKLTAQKPRKVISWPQLFNLQNQDGFWQLIPELGILLDVDVDYLINILLAKKGIHSLGPKGKEKLLQLIATLLVLQLIRFNKLEGLIFKSLTKLNDSPPSWAFDPVKKAAEWARRTEREFPAISQRLDLGKDWDTATKKLLGIKETATGPGPILSTPLSI